MEMKIKEANMGWFTNKENRMVWSPTKNFGAALTPIGFFLFAYIGIYLF